MTSRAKELLAAAHICAKITAVLIQVVAILMQL